MDPYCDAAMAQRKSLVLRRALTLYADGLDDAGAFARDVLAKMRE
jgi:hypothetical protein